MEAIQQRIDVGVGQRGVSGLKCRFGQKPVHSVELDGPATPGIGPLPIARCQGTHGATSRPRQTPSPRSVHS